jgi:FkbM family methyltransferase
MITRSLSALALTKVRLPFPVPHSRFNTLNFIRFMQNCGAKLSYAGINKLLIRDLDFRFDVKDANFRAYQIYFDVRDKMRVFRVGDKIFSEIDGLKFIVPFPFGLLELKETFLDNFYRSDRIKGKIVLDVGAFIGDTPVYFAWKKASHVFAFEPVASLFEIAKENIRLNSVSDKVTLRNEALADARKLLNFQYDENSPGGSRFSILRGDKTCIKIVQVQATALQQVLSETGDVGLLKMDIEGAEHQVISDACKRKLLGPVESIIMEVHGTNAHLRRLLEADGYAVEVLRAFSSSVSLVSAVRS